MGVDVSKFGRGQSKQLESLFQDLDVSRSKCYLRLNGHRLERRVELVRINLNTTGSDGIDRTLKVGMEVMDDGRTRMRNQIPTRGHGGAGTDGEGGRGGDVRHQVRRAETSTSTSSSKTARTTRSRSFPPLSRV
ncbi:unnamed protein product [Prorocentrum cordatum]|uniref:Uncharacterized protein n=1 Tax=Prorocentrum cordatum TaxID=2364126 RepID=A0ABN9QH99_9DINO|nr:unnamed protein product [Polarella glacialis]